ncbi:MAG: carbonic anhydrase [Eubacteriales bacterium]|nr:carbonic anhydrase [Eubacteriales bacterium]
MQVKKVITVLDEILKFNQAFVMNRSFEPYVTSKLPTRKLAILTCMDTRLTELLPAALGVKNGDIKLIKNAGAMISSPFGSVMRSLIVAIYAQEVEEILVIGHHDCGMRCFDNQAILQKMKNHGITEEKIEFLRYCGIDFETWLNGFEDVFESVRSNVDLILHHPLIPADVKVFGLVMDPHTGQLEVVNQ